MELLMKKDSTNHTVKLDEPQLFRLDDLFLEIPIGQFNDIRVVFVETIAGSQKEYTEDQIKFHYLNLLFLKLARV